MAVMENGNGAGVDLGVNGVASSAPDSNGSSPPPPAAAAPDSNGSSHPHTNDHHHHMNHVSLKTDPNKQQQQQHRMLSVSVPSTNHKSHLQFQQQQNHRDQTTNINGDLQMNGNLMITMNGGGGGGGIHHNNSNSGGGFGHAHRRSSSANGAPSAVDYDNNNNNGECYKRDIRELEELLSKLNPMAEEFVPPSLATNHLHLHHHHFGSAAAGAFYANNFLMHSNTNAAAALIDFSPAVSPNGSNNNNNTRRKRTNYSHGKRRINSRTSMAQRDDVIRRTVYVSDIDQQVTEEQLAALFINCGQVVDCRICGDPNSVLRFAFIEFTDEEGARGALTLAGTMLGFYPVRVLPSKTAIAPVNPTFLPRSEDEREMCARTIYCTNIDKKVSQSDVKGFFEQICGPVFRLRLLGDYHHSTRIAFVEFVMAESAIAALNCSGVVLGSMPIRISPSKTPVRPRAPRAQMH